MKILKHHFNMNGTAALALAFALGAPVAHAQTAVKKAAYESFRTLQSRNIFDPDRSRDLGTQTQRTRPTEVRNYNTQPAPPPKPSDYVELTGVMTTEGETFAFFAGSQAQYNKVVAVNGVIAGATITKITSAGIEVTRDGRQIAVPVGRTLPLDNSEPGLPPVAAAAPVSAPPAVATSTAAGSAVDPQAASQQVPVPDATSGSAAAAPGTDNNISDAMRRMIERRQKELNQ